MRSVVTHGLHLLTVDFTENGADQPHRDRRMAHADLLHSFRLAQAFAGLQPANVLADVLALAHELGIGGDQADQLLAAHAGLARCLAPDLVDLRGQ